MASDIGICLYLGIGAWMLGCPMVRRWGSRWQGIGQTCLRHTVAGWREPVSRKPTMKAEGSLARREGMPTLRNIRRKQRKIRRSIRSTGIISSRKSLRRKSGCSRVSRGLMNCIHEIMLFMVLHILPGSNNDHQPLPNSKNSSHSATTNYTPKHRVRPVA